MGNDGMMCACSENAALFIGIMYREGAYSGLPKTASVSTVRKMGWIVVSEAAGLQACEDKQAINYGLMKIEVLDRIPITREIR